MMYSEEPTADKDKKHAEFGGAYSSALLQPRKAKYAPRRERTGDVHWILSQTKPGVF